MAFLRVPRGWEIPEGEATPESIYEQFTRRRFLRDLALAGLGAGATLLAGPAMLEADNRQKQPRSFPASPSVYPARRNPKFTLDRPLTDEKIAASYNNFYEFSEQKEEVAKLAARFETRPWTVEIAGLVHKPLKFDVDELTRLMPIEERLYRLRCVEAWAMAVPWTGFPFKALMDRVEPLAKAKFVRMVSFERPSEAPGQRSPWYPWPYFEALTMAEAANELTLLVTGIYGHELPPQHGAPIRLIVPWKYGFKSIKSIVRIEFVERQPETFWHKVVPGEYDFWANVNPRVPHPRWSQATERMIGTNERRPTLLYNGYGEFVAGLYS